MTLVRASLSEQIYKQLRKDIMLGNISAGQKLLLRDLQDQFEVSCTPVRDAITRLAKDGFVDYITNHGAKVIDLTSQDVQDLLELCSIYDCHAIRQAAKSKDRAQLLVELQEAIDSQRKYILAPEKTAEEYSFIFADFHERLYTYAGNAWLQSAAMQSNSLLFLADIKRQGPYYPENAIEEHQQILNAIAEERIEDAVSLANEHRLREKQRYLF